MPTCRYCGAEIAFIRTPRGRRVPVDPGSFRNHDLVPGVTVITDGGQSLRGGHHPAVAAYGYTPHRATCAPQGGRR